MTKAERLTLYLSQTDHHGRLPLYVEIIDRARRARLAGATVLQGDSGFGHSARLHHAHTLPVPQDVPVVVIIVDASERIDAFVAEISPLLSGVVVLRDDVEIVQAGE